MAITTKALQDFIDATKKQLASITAQLAAINTRFIQDEAMISSIQATMIVPKTPSIIFSTTFADALCPTWNQTMGLSDAAVCQVGDGIAGYGAWTAPNHPNGDEIVSAANNPGGGGGKGFRHWVGNGANNGGGMLLVTFPARSELWIRYYVREQLGFAWNPTTIFQKQLYINTNIPGTLYWGVHSGFVGGHVEQDDGGNDLPGNYLTSMSWAASQGGSSTGDGTFHRMELHLRMNSPGGAHNGILECWYDGTKLLSFTNVRFSLVDGATWSKMNVSANENDPQSGSPSIDQYTDFDDIAISDSGYIGSYIP